LRPAAAVVLAALDRLPLRDVNFTLLGSAAERDRRRMLEKENGVEGRAVGDRSRKRALELERLAIVDRAEVEELCVEKLCLAGHAGSVALQPMESKPAVWGDPYAAVFAEQEVVDV